MHHAPFLRELVQASWSWISKASEPTLDPQTLKKQTARNTILIGRHVRETGQEQRDNSCRWRILHLTQQVPDPSPRQVTLPTGTAPRSHSLNRLALGRGGSQEVGGGPASEPRPLLLASQENLGLGPYQQSESTWQKGGPKSWDAESTNWDSKSINPRTQRPRCAYKSSK